MSNITRQYHTLNTNIAPYILTEQGLTPATEVFGEGRGLSHPSPVPMPMINFNALCTLFVCVYTGMCIHVYRYVHTCIICCVHYIR